MSWVDSRVVRGLKRLRWNFLSPKVGMIFKEKIRVCVCVWVPTLVNSRGNDGVQALTAFCDVPFPKKQVLRYVSCVLIPLGIGSP